MIPQEMNIKIAGILGYTDKFCFNWLCMPLDSNGIPLDYTTDWNLCGPLVEKLGDAGWEYYKDAGINYWCKYNEDGCFVVANESLRLATCLAFIEEFGE